MKKFFHKNRKWFAYFLYCFFVVVALLYIRFPSALFKDYLQAAANGRNSGVELTIQELHPVFPPGMVLTGVKLTSRKRFPEALFFMQKASPSGLNGCSFFSETEPIIFKRKPVEDN